MKARNGCYIIDDEIVSRRKGKLILAPLRSACYHIEIVNSITNVALRQEYYNPTEKFLEMEYCFPVNPEICIYRFTAEFTNIKIEGTVKEK
jgi:hypothetical protein